LSLLVHLYKYYSLYTYGDEIRRGHTSNGRPASPHSFHSRYGSTMLKLRYSELVIAQKKFTRYVPRYVAVGTVHGAF
jgi:hypothetical protein